MGPLDVLQCILGLLGGGKHDSLIKKNTIVSYLNKRKKKYYTVPTIKLWNLFKFIQSLTPHDLVDFSVDSDWHSKIQLDFSPHVHMHCASKFYSVTNVYFKDLFFLTPVHQGCAITYMNVRMKMSQMTVYCHLGPWCIFLFVFLISLLTVF